MGGSLANISRGSACLIVGSAFSVRAIIVLQQAFNKVNSDFFPLCLISYPQIEENPAFVCVDLHPMIFKGGPGYLRI